MALKYIVITSIFKPTPAVSRFAELSDYRTLVVGDKKSPAVYEADNVKYLSISDQAGLSSELEKILPFNHYCRKNIGYIFAINEGAKIIIDTDDDNIPYSNWKFPSFNNTYDTIIENKGFINTYQYFTKHHIWPRGFPLNLILEQRNLIEEIKISNEFIPVGVWQGLADEDPDVDAIYRLSNNTPCYFEKRDPIVLKKGTISPFNSQNTAFRQELFPLLYLPSTVTFRFTDILRGLIAQPIMWACNYYLGFTEATVKQERNMHDYMSDFESEIPCYLHSEKVINLVSNNISSNYTIYENLFLAYEALHKEQIVLHEELERVDAWINDIKKPHPDVK
jgi:hypothetical protein